MKLSIEDIDRYLVAAKEAAGADWYMSGELQQLDWLLREVVSLRSATSLATLTAEKACKCGEVVKLGVRVFVMEEP